MGGKSPTKACTTNTPTSVQPSPSVETGGSGIGRFTFRLSGKFVLATFLISTLVTFSVGWVARLVLLSKLGIFPSSNYFHGYYHEESTELAVISTKSKKKKSVHWQLAIEADDGSKGMSGKGVSQQLPAPKVIAGKEVPYTTYTSKTFHTSAVTTANTLHIDRTATLMEMFGKSRKGDGGKGDDIVGNGGDNMEGNGYAPCSASSSEGSKMCSRGKVLDQKKNEIGSVNLSVMEFDNAEENNAIINDYSHNSDEDGLHLPAGQHLLVDIKDIDSNFLDSEERLATAMIELINESKLTLLSYHCHSLVPIGVSCVGVLLESHISFHTWPLEGVITLDLFTCGGNPLIPVLPSIKRLFGVAREVIDDVYMRDEIGERVQAKEELIKPSMLWAHKLRGFREGFAPSYSRDNNPLDLDLGRYVLGKLDFDIKRPLISTETDFQRVDVYELLYSNLRNVDSYYKGLDDETGTSYEARHPELFAPDRVLFLDGVIQSSLYGDAAYHESIVHPAMMTHSNPKKVAIIGGGEGATLREVLKHRSVEKAVMIEIDEEIVTLSRDILPEWSDCSDIVGSTAWCLEDERVEARYEDAIQYFKSRFTIDGTVDGDERFDVIIMDALDPNMENEFALDLYKSDDYIRSLYNGLTESGVLAVQIGETPGSEYPPDEIGQFANRAHMIQGLEVVGFQSIHVYEESHSGFQWPWSTVVAFKDFSSRASWYRSSAEFDLDVCRRLLPTKSGSPALRNYDGAQHHVYQSPSKVFESNFCLSQENHNKCTDSIGFPPNVVDMPAPSVEVKKIISAEGSKEVGLFARNDLPKNSFISLNHQVAGFIALPSTWSVLKTVAAMDGLSSGKRSPGTISKFVNYMEGRGFCSSFLGKSYCCAYSAITIFMRSGNEFTSNYNFDQSNEDKTSIYCPVIARHIKQFMASGKMTTRHIKAGEELLA
mmetsp:Transcript_6974/g.14557  ORF Transcript_6974/g.14557 Transcript_6974/m.14557 type:complete len:939 (+) Transcript_6974:74-2890(+)